MEMICTACKDSPVNQIRYCHECNGLGYIEFLPKCSQQYPECPIGYEPMMQGWYCSKCRRSGPI